MVDETQDETPHPSPAGPVGEGAAEAAPTAPHATSRRADAAARVGLGRKKKAHRPSGPERFWKRRRGFAMVLAALASLGIHYALSPFALLPAGGLEVKDQAGDLAIPVDIFNEAPEAPPPPPPGRPPIPRRRRKRRRLGRRRPGGARRRRARRLAGRQ